MAAIILMVITNIRMPCWVTDNARRKEGGKGSIKVLVQVLHTVGDREVGLPLALDRNVRGPLLYPMTAFIDINSSQH